MKIKEDMLGCDFQGWPIYKKNLREIISAFGFTKQDGKWTIEDSNPLLDIYPTTLQDHGMVNGINPKFIEEIDSNENAINIFIGAKNEKEKE